VAPPVIEYLLGLSKARPSNDIEAQVSVESIKMLETLVALTDEHNRIQMLLLLVPILVSLLLETSELSGASKPVHHIHEHALHHLTCIGPQYPAQFRTIMQASPDLRSRLEAAVKAQQASAKFADRTLLSQKSANKEHKPSIKLKTNFGNFTG
jgi:hypothetical protein